MDGSNGPFSEWREVILHELSRHDKAAEALADKFDDFIRETDEKFSVLRIELTKLQIKAGLWGALAGAIPALTGVLIAIFKLK